MLQRRTVIRNRLGLHARPAMAFASLAGGFACQVRVRRADAAERVDGKSVMQMLMLACTTDTQIEIECEGADEAAAMEALLRLVDGRFEED